MTETASPGSPAPTLQVHLRPAKGEVLVVPVEEFVRRFIPEGKRRPRQRSYARDVLGGGRDQDRPTVSAEDVQPGQKWSVNPAEWTNGLPRPGVVCVVEQVAPAVPQEPAEPAAEPAAEPKEPRDEIPAPPPEPPDTSAEAHDVAGSQTHDVAASQRRDVETSERGATVPPGLPAGLAQDELAALRQLVQKLGPQPSTAKKYKPWTGHLREDQHEWLWARTDRLKSQLQVRRITMAVLVRLAVDLLREADEHGDLDVAEKVRALLHREVQEYPGLLKRGIPPAGREQ